MKVFETDRYTVRRLEQNDIDPFHDMQSNLDVMRYVKPAMNREESERELIRFIDYYDDDVQFDIWAIEQKSNNEFVGICGVYENDDAISEIAYRLREPHWGKGIASEVTQRLIAYCFNHTSIEELCAYVRLGNEGSIRILEKMMNFEKQFYSEKGKSEERYYILSKKEWASREKVVIEQAQVEDAFALTNLSIRSKAHWNYGEEQINKWLQDLTITESYITESVVNKLVEEDDILGYYSLIHISGKIIKMDNLFIEPDCIGQGYGALLLKHACQWALSNGYNMMTLDADPHAEQFYLRKGFKVIGQLPTSIEGRFLPIMEKKIS